MSGAPSNADRPVIFDLDGTLVDSGADIAAAANHVRIAAGLPPLAPAVALSFVGDGVQLLLERVLACDPATGLATRPVAPPELAAGLARFADHYAEHLLDRTVLYPGVADLLAALAGRPLFIATNKPRRFTLAILAGLGVDHRFRRIVAGDDVVARKPDPAHLEACLAGTRLVTTAATVVGDSPNDVRSARGCGARAVAVSWGLVAAERLVAERPDALVHDASQLARELGAVL